MSRLFFEVPPRLRLLMLLLAVLPCVPGLTFLAAGAVRDPRWSVAGLTFANRADDRRAAPQAHALYQAGKVTLGAGVLFGVFVGWKVLRRRSETDEGVEE